MKRQLTPDQITARDARRAKFKLLWQQIAKLSNDARLQPAMKYGIRTVDGHELSPVNQCLIASQLSQFSVVGGFRQWLAHGRAVIKGQHGAMIWIPTGLRKSTAPNGEPTTEQVDETRFVTGTVFDISQTQEIDQTANRAALLDAQSILDAQAIA